MYILWFVLTQGTASNPFCLCFFLMLSLTLPHSLNHPINPKFPLFGRTALPFLGAPCQFIPEIKMSFGLSVALTTGSLVKTHDISYVLLVMIKKKKS